MLKLLNFSKSRGNYVYRHISTSFVRWQGGELTKAPNPEDAIRIVEKKPQRLPLVKNFFLAIVDTDLIAFPEVIYENEHQEVAKQRKKLYEDFLETNIFSNPDDENNINKLKEFGCFGKTSPLITEALFSFTEAEGKYLSYGSFLNNHQLVLKLLHEFGEPHQKLKYAAKLESGDSIAVPCFFESEMQSGTGKLFGTRAKFDDSRDKWILNGEKSFVLISPAHKDSTTFLVIASTDSTDHLGDFKEGLNTMLVDGSLPGVSIAGVDETIGFGEKPFSQVTVSFKDVVLDKSDALGDDPKVLEALINMARLNIGAQALSGVMKPMIKRLADYSINTKENGVHLKDVDTVKERLGSMASSCYALESMIYMTAGLSDIYDKQDIELESAIVHAFAIQAATDFFVRPLHAIGPKAVIRGAGYDRLIRDAAQLAAAGEQLDGILQFISLVGLNFTGLKLNEIVKKNRNPLNHPAFVFSRIFKQTSIDHPRKKLNLEEYLHPSLRGPADGLEFSILRLNAAADILLARHGSLIGEHPVEVTKLAEAAVLCYAMFCSAARASRSYCIGLRNADQEMSLVNYFCFEAAAKVKSIAQEIDSGEYGTSEHTYKKLGQKLIETKEYHLEHPTARNF